MLLSHILLTLSAAGTLFCLLTFFYAVIANPVTPDDVPEWPAIGIFVFGVLTLVLAIYCLLRYLVS